MHPITPKAMTLGAGFAAPSFTLVTRGSFPFEARAQHVGKHEGAAAVEAGTYVKLSPHRACTCPFDLVEIKRLSSVRCRRASQTIGRRSLGR